MSVQRVAVLSDSLAVSPSRAEGFPRILQELINEAGFSWTVANAGVFGETTAGGLRRLDDVLALNPRILIVALGANDGLRGLHVATIAANLRAIIRRAKQQSIQSLLCGMETPPFRGWPYTTAFHEIYPELARTERVPLVPFLLANVALNREMNGPDLIHPNAAGARQIAATVWPHLESLLVSSRVASE